MPLAGGIVGTSSPCSDVGPVANDQQRADQDAEAHDADEQFHQPLEPRVAADPDEHEADQAVRDGAPRLRDGAAGEIRDAQAGGVGERGAHGHGPEHEIGAEVVLHPGRQVRRPAFERRQPGRQLPARDAFAEHELEERAERDRPEQHDAVARAADRRRHDVAGSDAGGRDDQAGTGELEEVELPTHAPADYHYVACARSSLSC